MRMRWWSLLVALGVARLGTACGEESLSLGEDRCYGEETTCERPCTASYDERRRAVDETILEPAEVVPVSGDLCEEAGLPCNDRSQWARTLQGKDSARLIVHANGELSIFIGTYPSEVDPEAFVNDLHVVRLAEDGELLWSRNVHRKFWDIGKRERDIRSLTAVAEDRDNGLLMAVREETEPPTLKVTRISSSGEVETLFTVPSADAPRAVRRWNSDILVVTHFEVALYEPDGSLVWRQTELENAPSTREPSPYVFSHTMAVELAQDADGNMIVLRKESNYQIALLKLSPNGNVLTHAYLPAQEDLSAHPGQDDFPAHCTTGEMIQPLHPGDPGARPGVPPNGRVPRPTGNTRYEPDVTASTPDAEELFSVATLDVDGAGHPVTLQGNVVGRFPSWAEYDATDPNDDFHVEAVARPQEFASFVRPLDLAVGPRSRVHVLTNLGSVELLIDDPAPGNPEVGYTHVIDRFTFDADDGAPPTREVIPLATPLDGTRLVFDYIRFGPDCELYAYARNEDYTSIRLVRIELPE